jgi:lipid A ethanolaminephosphotransferase
MTTDRFRLHMTSNLMCLLAAAWIVLTANRGFWTLFRSVEAGEPGFWLFAASITAALVGLNMFLVRLLSPGRTLRVMLSVLLVLAAATSWFMDTYGVSIDTAMLRNVVQTNPAEARDFLGWPLLWRLIWQAGLPMLFVWRAKLPAVSWARAVREYVVGAVLGLAVLLLAALPLYVSYASFFRNQSGARHLLAPANVVVSSINLARRTLHARVPYVQVGLDARRSVNASARPLLVVMAVGETARAANFSLGGYGRPTNTLLAQRNVLYFNAVHSCGTATAMSVPCMFSDLPREEFDLSAADRRDSVLDVLQRAGLDLTWIDNQSGCKGVCDRVPTELASKYHPQSCTDGECLDDALLYAMDSKLPQLNRDSVWFLHMMGSHGPTYHRRVPPEMQVFKPICPTERIETCSKEQIVNSYDNSIVYTDFALAGVIDRLTALQDKIDSVVIYVSDHGESLGENGLYLHGQPYSVAPDVQKHVPMLMWFSPGATQRLALDVSCVQAKLHESLSHDYISHTLLGLGDVATTIYRPQLDLLRSCRAAAP